MTRSTTPSILLIPALALSFSTQAATLLESQYPEGMTSRIYIDHNRARFDMPGQEGKVVIDLDKNTMHLIIDAERMVINMSQALKASKDKTIKQPGLEIRTKGNGPTIAGYATKEYEEYVDGDYCGTVYNSKTAMQELGIDKFARAFTAMAEEINSLFSSMPINPADQFLDKCERADISFSYKMQEVGFPLKSLDQNRQQDSLVTKIDKSASLPANAFAIPKGYKVTTAQNFMNDMMQKIPENLQNMMQSIPPEALENMGKQMMQNMPPEMIEMMKKQMQGQQ